MPSRRERERHSPPLGWAGRLQLAPKIPRTVNLLLFSLLLFFFSLIISFAFSILFYLPFFLFYSILLHTSFWGHWLFYFLFFILSIYFFFFVLSWKKTWETLSLAPPVAVGFLALHPIDCNNESIDTSRVSVLPYTETAGSEIRKCPSALSDVV